MKPSVLIIEDNEQNMYMETYLIENSGYRVFQAFNGIDGISKARETKPDIILLDIQLPEMNGYEIAMELKKIEELINTPIIAVTSYAMLGDKEKALAAGAIGYIEKPIDPETFISQMEAFIPHNFKNGDKS